MNRQLTTQRLQLRPLQIDDVELVHELWTNRKVRYFLFDVEGRPLLYYEHYRDP